MRIVIVIKRLEDRYQAQLRPDAGSRHRFFSARENRSSKAKRAAEEIFGDLDWQDPPAALLESEPDVLQVAYWNGSRSG